MSIGQQLSILDISDETSVGPLDAQLTRTALTDGAWIDFCPGWIRGAGLLFDQLISSVDWRAEQRRMYERTVDVPRLLSFYDEGNPLPHQVLERANRTLNRHYAKELGEPFTTAGLCLYRDGRDSVAWHGDTIGRGRTADTMVAIVSLGAARALLLRPRAGGPSQRPGASRRYGSSLRYDLGHGDLLVMGGSCQRTWEHAVAKTARAVGQRISVQFRPAGVR